MWNAHWNSILTSLHLSDYNSPVFNEMSLLQFQIKVGTSSFYIPDIFKFEISNLYFFSLVHMSWGKHWPSKYHCIRGGEPAVPGSPLPTASPNSQAVSFSAALEMGREHPIQWQTSSSLWASPYPLSLWDHVILKIYVFIFIYLATPVLVAACGIFYLPACGLFRCGTWGLVPWPRIELGPPDLGAES